MVFYFLKAGAEIHLGTAHIQVSLISTADVRHHLVRVVSISKTINAPVCVCSDRKSKVVHFMQDREERDEI